MVDRNVTPQELAQPVRAMVREVETDVHQDLTVAEALKQLHDRTIDHKIFYIYVVDDDRKLVGVLPTRQLLLAEPEDRLRDIMLREPIAIQSDATLGEALEMFNTHRLLAFPVVDDDGHMLGLIDVRLYTKELHDLAESHRTVDLFQMIGVQVQQLRSAGLWRAYVLRMPWLVSNFIGGVACAGIAAIFRDVLAEVIVLAMFIPLVLTLCESISIQALSLTLYLVHARGVDWRRFRRRLYQEWRIALLLGLTAATLVAGAGVFWSEGVVTPMVMLISVGVSMLVAATWGTTVPILLHAGKLDPRLAAGPLILALADISAMAIYLGLATALLT